MRRPSWFTGFGLICATGTLACGGTGGVDMRFVLHTPHEQYQAKLRAAGLHETALARDWIAAGEVALAAPRPIDLPYREVRYLDPRRAAAVAYGVSLERGQRLAVRVSGDTDSTDLRLFLDLFHQHDTIAPPRLVHSADFVSRELTYVAMRPGWYVLRVQPELLRGGRLILTLSAHASLEFPVAGLDLESIRSRYGAPRDGGNREHHGVDIFAPRGTPVVAAIDGYVASTRPNRLGGNVVWLRDQVHGRSLYYAHLDSHVVRRGMRLRVGDTVGFVGNSGNARRTPPHLHFGIYLRGAGPVDPYYHLFEPVAAPPAFRGDATLVGRDARTRGRATSARTAPDLRARIVAEVAAGTPVEVLGGVESWYLVRLPFGENAYVPIGATEPRPAAVRAAMTTGVALLRREPHDTAAVMEPVAAGFSVAVLGSFGDYVLIERHDGLRGWLRSSIVTAVGAAAAGGR